MLEISYFNQGICLHDEKHNFERIISTHEFGKRERAGLLGTNQFWILSTDGVIRLFDTHDGNLNSAVQIDGCFQMEAHKNSTDIKYKKNLGNIQIFQCDKRRSLFIISYKQTGNRDLKITEFSFSDMRVLNHYDLPENVSWDDWAQQQDHLLFWKRSQHETSLLRLNKDNGQIEHASFGKNNAGVLHFPSPCGKYWLRRDNRLPMKRIDGKTYCGKSLQIWQAFPPKFLRRVTYQWVESSKILLDFTKVDSTKQFRQISRALEKYATDEIDTLSADYFKKQKLSEAEWQNLRALWMRCFGFSPNGNLFCWDPDSRHFWLGDKHVEGGAGGFGVICIGVDGTVSPILFPRRFMQSETEKQRSLQSLRPLGENKLRLEFWHEESVVVTRLTTSTPWIPEFIEEGDDDWQPSEMRWSHTRIGRISDFRRERATVRIRLESLSACACRKAIEDLTDKIDLKWPLMAYDDEITIRFEVWDNNALIKALTEREFFEHVARGDQEYAPTLKALIEAYCERINSELFSVGDEGEGLLAYAAVALATVSEDSVALLERFGDKSDRGHEYVYAQQTAKKLLSRSKYDATLHEFALRFIAKSFYNSVESSDIWLSYGVRWAAQSTFTPAEYAKLILETRNSVLESPDAYRCEDLLHAFDSIRQDIIRTDSIDSWEASLFDELSMLNEHYSSQLE